MLAQVATMVGRWVFAISEDSIVATATGALEESDVELVVEGPWMVRKTRTQMCRYLGQAAVFCVMLALHVDWWKLVF